MSFHKCELKFCLVILLDSDSHLASLRITLLIFEMYLAKLF